MLDAALEDCVYGMSAKALTDLCGSRDQTTAFSQPTQAGTRLALHWLSVPGGRTCQLFVFDEPSS